MPKQLIELLLTKATDTRVKSTVAPPAGQLPAAQVLLETSLVTDAAGTPALRVKVSTPSLVANRNTSLLSAFDHISAPMGGMRGRAAYMYQERLEHGLAPVLDYVLRGSAALQTMKQRLDFSGQLSLATVLQKVEADKDLPEAEQPAGLAAGIALHDYQRCACLCSSCAHSCSARVTR